MLEPAHIIQKAKGSVLIDREGYNYYKIVSGPKKPGEPGSNKIKSRITWRCSKYKKDCRAKIITVDNIIVSYHDYHNH